jgi:hypothetical protein
MFPLFFACFAVKKYFAIKKKNLHIMDTIKIFYGAAIQGAANRRERAPVHRTIIDAIKRCGCRVVSEHTVGTDYENTAGILENTFHDLPPKGSDRTVFVRRKMIELVEGDIDGAIFEVSTPSLGTGVEIAHAYLRPRLGLRTIPVLALYQKGFWPNKLSSMIQGITHEELSHVFIKEYEDPKNAYSFMPDVIKRVFKNQ